MDIKSWKDSLYGWCHDGSKGIAVTHVGSVLSRTLNRGITAIYGTP